MTKIGERIDNYFTLIMSFIGIFVLLAFGEKYIILVGTCFIAIIFNDVIDKMDKK